MCGINGIFKPDSSEEQVRGIVQRMNQTLAHRGPDDQGVLVEGALGLGHRRLSIIDLSDAGHQPMVSANERLVMVYNGEMYNFQELRDQLSYPFRSQTDSEVILAAWQEWGPSCVERFNGMFAFALWDRQENELFLVRDRLGIKPLYYYHDGSNLLFSSEVRSLLTTDCVPRKLNRTALVDYLRYQCVHWPDTMVEGVSMLPPGRMLRFKDQTIRITSYWNWQPQPEVLGYSRETAYAKVYEKLLQAVERRLIADVPFGAFLSGGIDSSAIVALMSQVTSDVNTFTVVFEEEAFNEAPYADIIAKKFGTKHHEIHLQLDKFLEMVPVALEHMDHPSGDGPNTYVVSKATKEAGLTVALSGLGGDELFAGYSHFSKLTRLRQLGWLNKVPRPLRSLAGHVLHKARPKVSTAKIASILKLPTISPVNAYPTARQAFLEPQIAQLLGSSSLPANRVQSILEELSQAQGWSSLPPISQISMAEIYTYMQNTLLRDTDQMSMAHALEVRVPLLDHEVVELVLGLSDAHKHFEAPKSLLLGALGDLLPREVTHRKKMGFTLPFPQWMKNELRDFCWQRLERLAQRDIFHGPTVRTYWDNFQRGNPTISWSRLWLLVVLEQWLEQHHIH